MLLKWIASLAVHMYANIRTDGLKQQIKDQTLELILSWRHCICLGIWTFQYHVIGRWVLFTKEVSILHFFLIHPSFLSLLDTEAMDTIPIGGDHFKSPSLSTVIFISIPVFDSPKCLYLAKAVTASIWLNGLARYLEGHIWSTLEPKWGMDVGCRWAFCQWPQCRSASFHPSLCFCFPYIIPLWHLLSYFLSSLTSTTHILCLYNYRFAHESSLKSDLPCLSLWFKNQLVMPEVFHCQAIILFCNQVNAWWTFRYYIKL